MSDNDSRAAKEWGDLPPTATAMVDDFRAGIPDGWVMMVRLYAPLVLWQCRRGFPPRRDTPPRSSGVPGQEAEDSPRGRRIPPRRLSGVPDQDAEDLVRDVFLTVSKRINSFTKDGKPAAFRRWLYAITRVKVLEYWAAESKRPHGRGGDDSWIKNVHATDPLPEDCNGEVGLPPRVLILRRLLEQIQLDFEDRTFQAFLRVAVDGRSAQEVAEELGMKVGAVHTAKSRVLKRLREEFKALGFDSSNGDV